MSEATIDWGQILPGAGGTEVSRLCIGLLKKRLNDVITQAEFEHELNYVSMLTLDEMRPERMPDKPQVLLQFEEDKKKSAWSTKMPKDKAEIENKVCQDPAIQEYSTKSQSIMFRNRENALRLETMTAFFSGLGDSVSAQKCRIIYNEYPQSIYCGNRPIWLKRKL